VIGETHVGPFPAPSQREFLTAAGVLTLPAVLLAMNATAIIRGKYESEA
jgi:hypothetical protein